MIRIVKKTVVCLAVFTIWLWSSPLVWAEDEIDTNKEELKLRIEACSGALTELKHTVGNLRWADVSTDVIVRNAAAYERYDSACQKGLENLRHESTRVYLRDRLGALFSVFRDSAIPFCTAFRLSDTRVATAEHCLWDAGGKRRKVHELRFSLLGAPEERFSFSVLTDPAQSRGKLADKSDLAILELEPGARAELPKLSSDNRFDLEIPKDLCGDAFVLIPGVFRPALVVQEDLLPGDWAEAVRMDATDTCVRRSGHFKYQCRQENSKETGPELFYGKTNFRNRRCIVVNCQTYPGMSGAPVIGFSKAENTLFSGGVFIRSGDKPDVGRATCGDLPDMNIGITYSKKVIELMMEE
ncbi:hypothetical protein [uncultured Roseobacter sp.]|uniref:trypsin-like serine peptidase n=1 Tax=uncultured Roseobacter sp. TaxID=114847 RepID=UPI0026060786|nr:hypothetical protein [uncultured Roseobacter sp.]